MAFTPYITQDKATEELLEQIIQIIKARRGSSHRDSSPITRAYDEPGTACKFVLQQQDRGEFKRTDRHSDGRGESSYDRG